MKEPDYVARHVDEPWDRLTRVADKMIDTMNLHPEHQDGDRCIIMLMSADDSTGGVGLAGYGEGSERDDTKAISDLIMHLNSIMVANGKHLDIGFLRDNEGRIDWA